jgi:hypothetical protein
VSSQVKGDGCAVQEILGGYKKYFKPSECPKLKGCMGDVSYMGGEY